MPAEDPGAFLSYSRDDAEFVMRLAGDLKGAGANVWLDQLDIAPGQRWDRAVEEALGAARLMLVALTPAAVSSTNVLDEVSFALEEQKTVIPLLVRDCAIPFRLRRIQHVNFRTDYAGGLNALLRHLGTRQQEPEVTAAVSEAATSPHANRLDLKPFVRFGEYEVLSQLGQGGMGVVYRARDLQMGREVAIKVLSDRRPEVWRKYLHNAHTGALNHPNLVTVYDVGEQDGQPYVVMEFVRGDSLARLLKRGEEMSLERKLRIVREVCGGLHYAHTHGVLHCDVKPGSVIVQADGMIKLLDFGIAQLEDAFDKTGVRTTIGTLAYMSPERLKGEAPDARVDLWAAGVMLYQLLTGRLPFGEGGDSATLMRILNEPFIPLTKYMEDYPQALDGVLGKALAKDQAQRYASAQEMEDALAEVIRDLGLDRGE